METKLPEKLKLEDVEYLHSAMSDLIVEHEIVRRYNAHAVLVRACEAMRDEIMRLNNLSDGTWNDWDESYEVDAALSAAKGCVV